VRRTDDTTAKHRAILETAARLICKQGYEGTSIQEIADACGLTKAGLYHHIESKEQLLVEIMNYGMDVFEERVLSEVEHIPDPVERLKACMAKNIKLVTRGWSKEVTIILHEHDTLTGKAQAQINAREWCCGSTSGSSRAGSAPTTRSPRAWWICSSPAWFPRLVPEFVQHVARPRARSAHAEPDRTGRHQPLRVAGPEPRHHSLREEEIA